MGNKYLRLYLINFAIAVIMVFSFCIVVPEKINAAEFNLNQNSTVRISNEQDYESAGYTWIKYKAPANGYLTIEAESDDYYDDDNKYNRGRGNRDDYDDDDYDDHDYDDDDYDDDDYDDDDYDDYDNADGVKGYWRLYDSSKKTALSGNQEYNTYYDDDSFDTNTYGLKKGKTYYLRIQAYNGVEISSKFYRVSEKSGRSKTKAAALKKSRTVKGIISAGDNTADWYKIKCNKRQYVKFSYSGRTNAGLKITVYSGKKNIGKYEINSDNSSVKYGRIGYSNNKKMKKVNAGTTLYFKVERADRSSSGFYTLKWM